MVRIRTAEPDGDNAHAVMEKAQRRGACAVLADEQQFDELREQRTAWLMPDGQLVLSTWYQAPDGSWSRGPAYNVKSDGVTKLVELLEKNGR